MTVRCLTLLALCPLAARAELYPTAGGLYQTIVHEGEARAEIVLPREPREFQQFAAEELAAVIEQMSGVRLPIVATGAEAKEISLIIGDKARVGKAVDWRALGRDGFVMRSVPGGVVLCGNEDIGTVYAVYAFLEEQLGCRWFFPHKVGTVIPKTKTVQVGRFDCTRVPAYRFRHVGGASLENWGLKNRLTEGLQVAGRPYSKVWGTAHTFHKLLPMATYHPAHPEYFAQLAGARGAPVERKSHGPQICTSNPEATALTARNCLGVLSENPSLEMVNVGPNDGLRFCVCRRCRALDEGHCTWTGAGTRPQWRGVLSRRMMHFYNGVARRVGKAAPDKLVKVMFYSWYQTPPSDPTLKLAPNTLLMLTHSGNPSPYEEVSPSCYNHPIDDPQCRPNRERFYPAIQDWARRAPTLGIYEYYYKASVCHALFPIVHTIRSDIPTYHRLGARYFYTQGTWRNAAGHGLNYYVTAKLLWDLKTDVDALLADFYEKFYGRAREPMREYHELLERWMAERGGDVLGWPVYAMHVLVPENLRRARSLLDRAMAAADDATVKERVRLQQVALRYTDMCAQLARLSTGAAKSLRSEAYWRGMESDKANETLAAISAQQEQMREFIAQHTGDCVIGSVSGNYVKRWLSPRVTSLIPGKSTVARALQRPEWAKNAGLPPAQLPAKCDLWVYANDLDSSPDEWEHELYTVDPKGELLKLADFPARGQAANRRNGACIVKDLALRESADGCVELLVKNVPGHWTASTFFAFYLVDSSHRVSKGKAQAMIERDRDSLRRLAFAFEELGYSGAVNRDGGTLTVRLRLR